MPKKTHNILLTYQPNFVARQFGLCQILPEPLYHNKSGIFHRGMNFNNVEAQSIIRKFTGLFHITLVPFTPSYYCTKDFEDWWQEYYSSSMCGIKDFQKHLTKAFASVQDKTKKGTQWHIKEIQAFQKYFETFYNPTDLGRTTWDASVTLKEKFTAKLPHLHIP